MNDCMACGKTEKRILARGLCVTCYHRAHSRGEFPQPGVPDDLPGEAWRDVLGYSGLYEVSNLGRVRGLDRVDSSGKRRRGRLIKQFVDEQRRCVVNLWKNDKGRHIRVHTLVLEAFIGPRPPGLEGCHYDGNASNNNLSNLRWDTPLANAADNRRLNVHNNGKKTHCKRGHRLVPPNLSGNTPGKRECKSCLYGRTAFERHGLDIQEMSDKRYSRMEIP